MKVHKLTPEQAKQLKGQIYADGMYFNPVQDKNDIWFISVEEVNQCTNPDFMWVKDLDEMEYEPKQQAIQQ